MTVRHPRATTFGELLGELRDASVILPGPVIIAVDASALGELTNTEEQTVISAEEELDTVSEDYRRQYSEHPVFVLAPGSEPEQDASGITVGRSRSCSVRVEHESVSKHHATVQDEGQKGFFVLDESSLNGTFVNSLPVPTGGRALLCTGDRVSFGDAHFIYLDAVTVRRMVR